MSNERDERDVYQCAYCGRYFPIDNPHRDFTWLLTDTVNSGRDRLYILVTTCGESCASKVAQSLKIGG